MIYFDSAATTLQKPEAVGEAVRQAIGELASPGRGGHPPAMLAGDTLFHCRELAAELFDVPGPEHVVFTSNATHGLNIAIKSLVSPGGSVLISGYEHNAVTRTLAAIPGVRVMVAEAEPFDRSAVAEAFQNGLKSGPDAVVCTQVSNVFGFILPIAQISALCRKAGVPLVIDASQSAGCLPVRLRETGAAYIAMPGHKGLYGPQGTGMLLCAREDAVPLLEGGTGSQSALQQMPEILPDRLEAGTQNVCGIAGLFEGLRFVQSRGEQEILQWERHLTGLLRDGLAEIPGVRVRAPRKQVDQTGVCSFTVDHKDCEVVGQELGARQIAVRAGLHCAPLAHKTAGTLEQGTVRVSFSAFNQEREVWTFLEQLREIVCK